MNTNRVGIWRRVAILACLLPNLGAAVPAVNAAATPQPSAGEPVMLSEFEVKSDPGEDYRASNVISGTKFNTKLMELPKQIDVITDKFLEDLGTTDVLEALRYNSSIQLDTAEGVEVEEPQIVIRGYRADTTYVNVFTLMRGRLILLNGLRYGSVNNDSRNIRTKAYGIPFSQSALVSGHGVTYILIPAKLALFASYSESFVPLGGSDFYGKPFDPIEGSGIDYGIKFDLVSGRVSGSITSYVTDRDKALARDVDHAGFNVQERKQHSQGLEVGFQLRPLRDWQMLLNYGYCDIVTTGDPQAIIANTRQRNVPTHQGNVWNCYKLSEGRFKGLSLGIGVIRLGNRRGNDTRLDIPGLQLWPFTKVDASLGYDFKLGGRRATIQVSGTNLLDRQFIDQYRYYAAPRAFNSTLRLYL